MIKEEIEKFKKGQAVLALKNSFAVPSYFEIMGVQRSEKVYSNVLAWLLNPKESHGLGCWPMRLFLMAVRVASQKFRKSSKKCVIPFWLNKIGMYKIKSVDVIREFPITGIRRRMDMFCQMVVSVRDEDIKCQVVIENKVDSYEHDCQTETYYNFVCEKYGGENALFVFLTPESSWRLTNGFGEVECSSTTYVHLNYQLVVEEMLELIVEKLKSSDARRCVDDLITAMRYDAKKENVMAVSTREQKLLKEFINEQKDFLKRVAVSLGYCQADEELNLVGLAMNKRDRTQYSLCGSAGMAMNRLVLAVVKEYVARNKNCTWEQLNAVFPKELQGSFGVVVRVTDDLYINHRDDPTPRYFDDSDEIIMLKDDTEVVVCTQWGTGGKLGQKADNFGRFLKHVKKALKYKVKKVVA